MINEYWATHVLHDNINDENYVLEIYNWLMQNYGSSTWPSNHTDIDLFDEDHTEEILQPLKHYIQQQVKAFSLKAFGTSDNLRVKCHATNHSSIVMHEHSGAVISGVFYLHIPNGELRLFDPRMNAERGYPGKYKNYFEPMFVTPKSGDIVMFPSFVWHDVRTENPQQRIIMPFDVYVDEDVL